MERYI